MKPSFFKNELLATSDALNAWVFEGLWCLADREGRLEDRPRRIHLEINPGRAYEGTEAALAWLAEHGFILRYTHGRGQYIQVVNFRKHQNPHMREPASTIPPPGVSTELAPDNDAHTKESTSGAGTSSAPDEHQSGPADSSFPLPDSPSLIPLPTVESARVRADNPVAVAETPPAEKDRATRIPADFVLTPERRAVAVAERVDPERTFAKFVDYWSAAAGSNARKRNWDGTWRNWCRSEADRNGASNGAHRRNGQQKPSAVESVERATAEWAAQRGVDPSTI